MMPRFPGLSKPFDSFPNTGGWQAVELPYVDENGAEISLGHNGVTGPRKEWRLEPPIVPQDWHQLGVVTGTATPDAAVESNPLGATHPDLIVVPGQASGGGVSLGTVAILALLLVGGWFLYKRFA